MATEREEIRYEGGRGGKFQKRSGRRSHSTPYDRPPTAIRNAATNGWLSKLVDPAQKLIVSGAHRFFSTVFRKRLPPPPPSLPLTREANDEMENKNQEAVLTDPPGIEGAPDVDVAPSLNSNSHGVTELEQILKEKTFTRSEIDRLTELLNSRIVNVPSGVEERKSELVPSTPIFSHGRKEESLKIPAQDGVGTQMVSTHVAGPIVLEEDVASPAEIAKAYMGSRPSKATPFMASHSQTPGDNFDVSSNPSKSSFLSLVPRSSGNVDVFENGFVTPRSRGRSALYSMARMPYSRVRATPSIKNTVVTTDAYRATSSSSSQAAWEQGRLLGSKQQGALKRRSLVLDDDMGSIGPSRRIRQKSNLLSPKGLSLPISGSSTSTVSGIGSEAAQHLQSLKVQQLSSSAGNALYSSEIKRNLLKIPAEYENNPVPSSSFPPIPLRSSEMASKILEQLDKLTPPKEKSSELKLLGVRNNSPSKLSPSMLHGPALRSLENVDSPKYLENVQDTRLNDAQDFTTQKNDKVEDSSSLKFKVSYDRSISTSDGIGSTVPTKDTISSFSVPVSSVVTSSQTKWAFQMSAHEDYVDLDEEGYSNGVATDILAERREKVDGTLMGKKPSGTEAIAVEKPQALIEVKPSIFSEMNQVSDQGKSDVSVTTEKSASFSFPTAPSPSTTVNTMGPESSLGSEKIVSSEVPNATAPIFSFGDKLPSQKESIVSVPTFAFGDKVTPANEQNAVPIVTSGDNVAPTQLASLPATFNFGEKVTFPISANVATENGNKKAMSQFKFASSLVNEKESAKVGGASVFKAESSGSIQSFTVSKESMLDKADNKNLSAGLTGGTSENAVSTSTPPLSIFSFSSPSSNSNLNNGSLVSTPSFFPSPTSTISNNITNQNSTIKPSPTAATSSSEAITTTTSLSTSAPTPAFPAAPIFKFESSTVPSTSVSPVSAPTGVESVETQTKPETTFGNLSGTPPGGTSAKMSSTGSSVFQFGAAPTASDANKRSESSTFVSGNIPAFGAPILPASSGIASSTQSMPMQFSSSSTSFGLAGNTALSSGSSLFVSSAPASNLFSSGTTFGLVSSSSPAANSISSNAGTSSSFFNSPWQTSTAPSFSTAFNSTPTGFSFGLTSSTAASNSAPMIFGSSTSASTSSIFSFTSAAATTSSQPVFGNSNQPFAFGSTSSVNHNDQANMVDSMAEDTVQTIVSTPVFGQQPISPPPSSGFVFGSTAPLAANPFQFGSQQNVPTLQNPSPFQSSGSLDFNASAGGNFSLGAGGGDKSNRKYVKVKSKSRKK